MGTKATKFILFITPKDEAQQLTKTTLHNCVTQITSNLRLARHIPNASIDCPSPHPTHYSVSPPDHAYHTSRPCQPHVTLTRQNQIPIPLLRAKYPIDFCHRGLPTQHKKRHTRYSQKRIHRVHLVRECHVMRHVPPTTTTKTTTWFKTIKDYVVSLFFSPTTATITQLSDTFGSVVSPENNRPFFYHEPHAKHNGRYLTKYQHTYRHIDANPRPRLNNNTSLGSTTCRPQPKTTNPNAPHYFIDPTNHERPKHTYTYHTSLRRRTYTLPNTTHRSHQHPTQSPRKLQNIRSQLNLSPRKRHEGQNGQNTTSPHYKTPTFKKHLIYNTRQNFPQHHIQQNPGFTTAPTSKLAVIRPKRNKKKIRSRLNTKMYKKHSTSPIGPPTSANQKLIFFYREHAAKVPTVTYVIFTP